jgi:hypothetical protein
MRFDKLTANGSGESWLEKPRMRLDGLAANGLEES